MSEPQKFRTKPTVIEAMQWDGTEQAADVLYGWAIRLVGQYTSAFANDFMTLDDDEAIDIFGEDGPRGVRERRADGWTAVVYNSGRGMWQNVRVGDWIIKNSRGEHYAVRPDGFAALYEAVPSE